MISVVVPVYNCEKYLRECLDSILNQTYREFELILVDDGSKDSSGKTCDEYASNDNRIRVIHKDNEGACYARRDGVRVAKGEYICFVDGDDTIEVSLINTLTRIVNKYNPDIISYGLKNGEVTIVDKYCEGLYKNEKLESIKVSGFFSSDINEGRIIATLWSKLYRKELIIPYLESAAEGLRSWEDINYSYAPIFDAESVVIVHGAYYNYRVNLESLSKSYNWKELNETLYSLECAEKVYEKQSMAMHKALLGYALRILWGCFDRYYDLSVKTKDIENIKVYINTIKNSEFVKRALNQTKDMGLPRFELDFYEDCINKSEEEVLRNIAKTKLKEKIKRAPHKLFRIIGGDSK